MSRKPQKQNNNQNLKGRKNGRKPKVEIDIDRDDINKADLNDRAINSRSKNKRDGRNDVSWYSANESLLRDSASFPYSRPTGARITKRFNADIADAPLMSEYEKAVPGILTLKYSTATGSYNSGSTSPINVAANAIYTFVRHANSGSKIYDAPDLMMYLMAMDSAYSFYSYMVRLYGTIQLNSQYNRYMPKALVAAQMADYDDLSTNLAQFRYFINQYAFKLSQLCVPADMSIFARHVWMNSNIYMDAESVKAQYYMFVPNNYYHFVEQTDSPGYLLYKQYSDMVNSGTNKLNYNSLVNIANDILEPILQSEDMNVMSGDILKAFGLENIYKISPIAENYFVVPTYNAEVLSQIENCVVVGQPVVVSASQPAKSTWNIYQVLDLDIAGGPYLAQSVYTDPLSRNPSQDEAQIAAQVSSITKVINMHKDNVTPADTMVATRLTCLPTIGNVYSTETTDAYTVVMGYEFSGTEIVHDLSITTFEDRGSIWGTTVYENVLRYATIYSKSLVSVVNMQMKTLALLSKFDWHPEINYIIPTDLYDVVWDAGYTITDFLDVDNYTLMNSEDLQNMHETALLSLFSCPRMAALSSRPYNSR